MTAPPWTLSAQIQGIRLRVTGHDPQVRACIEEFVGPLVGGATAAVEELEFVLDVLEGERDRPAARGSKALIQFANVTCSWEEPWLVFQGRDGSFIKADPTAGRAHGRLSRDVLSARHLFTDLLLGPLMEMLKRRGYYGLHAAAVTKDGRGYLFPGGAGSGKTTIALGMIKQGFAYLADDKLLLRRQDDVILALAFTRYFNIDPEISQHYPELTFLHHLAPLPFTVKRQLDVSSIYPNTLASSSRPAYLIHLERAPDDRSAIVRLDPLESFYRLVHQTILAARKETARSQLALLSALVQGAESYLLRSGRDLFGSPHRLGELLPGPPRRVVAAR